jgi:hypothetical protein
MRVIYDQRSIKGERQLVCFFAQYRATIYSVLEQLLASGLIDELTDTPDRRQPPSRRKNDPPASTQS